MLPTPIVELNAAVALGLATDVERALEWIARLERHPELAGYHLLPASQADLLRRQGRFDEAAAGAIAARWRSSPIRRSGAIWTGASRSARPRSRAE